MLNEVLNGGKYCRKGMKWESILRLLGRGLRLDCAKVLHKGIFVSTLTYGSETMVWTE